MQKTKAAFQATLDRLKLDYLDLYLIHWPANEKQFGQDAEKLNAETWRAMEDLYNEGPNSGNWCFGNFLPHHIKALMKTAKIKPMVDQIEVHPGWPQTEAVQWLQDRVFWLKARGPLGGQGAKVLVNDTMKEIAKAHGKSTAQIALRWELQQGVLPLPKSVHRERSAQNMEIFDFALSESEMQMIQALPNLGGQCAKPDEVDF